MRELLVPFVHERYALVEGLLKRHKASKKNVRYTLNLARSFKGKSSK